MSASETRKKILSAASQLFLRGGLAGLSVRAIAREAGVSTIGIYSHFDGKQGILDSLYIEGFQRVAAAMEQASKAGDEHTDSRARVLLACNAYLDVAEQYSAHYRLIFGAADDQYQPSAEARDEAERAFKGLLSLTAQTLPNDATPAEVRQRAIKTWAILHGHVGLRQHAVSGQIDMAEWRQWALDAVAQTF